ncbi:MAG: hypothetical protein Q9218_000352 [Villophora microphyllina]
MSLIRATVLSFALLHVFLGPHCLAQINRRQETFRPIVQISDGQIQNPIPRCTTCETTLIKTSGGVTETVVLPAVDPSTARTTVPVNVNGQPRVAVVGPSGYISFLPPDDILVGGTVVTVDPTGFKVGTQLAATGRAPVTVDGETLSYGSKGLFVDGMPKTFARSPPGPTETISSATGASITRPLPTDSLTGIDSAQPYTDEVDSTTGGDRQQIISTFGHSSGSATLQASVTLKPTSASSNAAISQKSLSDDAILVGGETAYPEATGFIVGGKTVLPGGPAITISGYTLSLGTAVNVGYLVDDGTTIKLPVITGHRPAQTHVSATTSAKTTTGNGAAPHSSGATAQAQSSILNATGNNLPSTTTLIYNGQTEVFVKATLSDLTDLSTTRTIRTSISNHGSGWITGVPIVVFPHGIWWHGGLLVGGNVGGGGGFCFWPFCPAGGPPGGGGDSSDADPEENSEPEETKPGDPEKTQHRETEPHRTQPSRTDATQTSTEHSSSNRRTTSAPSTTRPTSTSYSNLGTISFDGDPMPDPFNAADLEDWGSTVYNRLVAAGFGEDVSNLAGVYTGATGTLLSSIATATSSNGSDHATGTTSDGGGLGGGAVKTATATFPPSRTNRQESSTRTARPVRTQGAVKPLSDCVLTTDIVGTTNTILTAGNYTYCECDSTTIAGTNTQLGPPRTTYIICAGPPYPTVSTIINNLTTAKPSPATSASATPITTTSAPAKPKPSRAIIIYREDSCDDQDCYSYAHVWAISPGQPINPCKNGTTDYLYHFPVSEANDDNDYAINIGPWTSFGVKMQYSGSNLFVGTLTGATLPGSPAHRRRNPSMILRASSWLPFALVVLALALQCALVQGDADFESVRVLMTQDSSGKGGDPEEKYWHESVFHPHYDGRFIDHELDYEDQRTNLTSLMQSYLSTMADLGAETWIIHGTLMGWWWNRKASLTTTARQTLSDGTQIMPWDSDIDVHVSEDTMHFLASYYNMTIHTVRTKHAPQGKNYMLEINPKWVDGSPEDELNQIDGRWIDMLSGVFIDITAVRRKSKYAGILFCKDRHRYRLITSHVKEADLFPLRDSVFEDRPVKIPYNYAELLQEEYGRVSLTRTRFAGIWYLFGND